MRTLALVSLSLLASLLLACSKESKPAEPTVVLTWTPAARPTPTVTPTATPPPTPAPPLSWQGPLLLYEGIGLRVYAAGYHRIVAYDLGGRRAVWELRLPFGADWRLAVAGHRVYVAKDLGVKSYDLDGGPAEDVFQAPANAGRITDIAVSRDGTMLAVALAGTMELVGTPFPSGAQAARYRPEFVFFDLAKAREISRIDTRRPELEGFQGYFGKLYWRDDEQGVFAVGYRGTEGWGSYATLGFGDRVIAHDIESFVSVAPSGRKLIYGSGTYGGCGAFGQHQVIVRDLDSGHDIVRIENDTRAFSGFDWSPDGGEFVMQSRAYEQEPAQANCRFGWWTAEPLWLKVTVSTGLIEVVPGIEAVYRRWQGDTLIWIDCEGHFVPVAGARISRTGWCLNANRDPTDGSLKVGDVDVAGGQGFTVHGFIVK